MSINKSDYNIVRKILQFPFHFILKKVNFTLNLSIFFLLPLFLFINNFLFIIAEYS